MNLQEYFEKVKTQISNGNFELIIMFNKPESKNLSVHIETINYILYEWNEDNKDPRNIFNYVLKPHNCDWDFTSIKFDEFFDFIIKQKDKENLIINVDTKEIVNKKKNNSKTINKSKSKKEAEKSSKSKKEKTTHKKEQQKKTQKERFEFTPQNPNPKLHNNSSEDEWDF